MNSSPLASCPEFPFVVFCLSSMGFKIPCLAPSLESHSTPLTPIPCPLTLPHPPSSCALAHRINKGNSKNIISKEKQFFLQQASLSVLLGALKNKVEESRGTWPCPLTPGVPLGFLHVTPMVNRGSSPSLVCQFPCLGPSLTAVLTGLLYGSGRTSEGSITRLPLKG